MGLKKGQTNNPRGRKKGTPNKITSSLREMISNFLDENFELMQTDFKEMDPQKRMKFYCDLLPYALPKLQTIEFQDNLDHLSDIQIDSIIEQIKKIHYETN